MHNPTRWRFRAAFPLGDGLCPHPSVLAPDWFCRGRYDRRSRRSLAEAIPLSDEISLVRSLQASQVEPERVVREAPDHWAGKLAQLRLERIEAGPAGVRLLHTQ